MNLGGLRRSDDGYIAQAMQLALQDGIGTQLGAEFDQRHMRDQASQIDRRFDAVIADDDDRNPLAFEQWAVAVRAIRHGCDIPVRQEH